jgi:hypothetical protein
VSTPQIIERLSKDGRFKTICRKLARKDYLADDLYQEFFLALCEVKDNRLVEAYENKYLEVLCVGIINNIWGKRNRVKTYSNGKTSPLYELTGAMWSFDFDPVEAKTGVESGKHEGNFKNHHEKMLEDKSVSYDTSKDEFLQEVRSLVGKSMNSDNENERFISRVFHYSAFKFKDIKEFSRQSKIPYGVCRRAYKEFKTKVEELKWAV